MSLVAFWECLQCTDTKMCLLGVLGAIARPADIHDAWLFSSGFKSGQTLTGIALNIFASAGTVFALYLGSG